MMNINLSELTGNAFALLLDRTGKRTLTVKQLEDFGHAAIQFLQDNNIDANLSNSFDKFPQSIAKYPNWFSYIAHDSLVVLNDNISVDNLYNQFACDLNPYVMYALNADTSTQFLLS